MPQLTKDQLATEMYYFNLGNHFSAYQFLGAKPGRNQTGQEGYHFTVWAPRAKAVALIGSFNHWQEEALEAIGETGAWTIFKPEAKEWDLYKFVVTTQSGEKKEKQDPFAFASEVPPKNASVIQDLPAYTWQDEDWLAKRQKDKIYDQPLNIYELHMSSWRRHPDGSAYTFDDLREALIPYVKEMGYTHIEFMPLMEHPLEASWGYQISGYYSIAGRFGHDFEPLMRFVDACHQAGIGVLVDWVPGHFVRNDDALAYYDGSPCFEFADSQRAVNNRWGTYNFDLGKSQVQSFLISNAIFWLEEFHMDGLRVDAVSNMLYLDYDIGDWQPNRYGNNVNLEGVDFLRRLNQEIFLRDDSYLMIAEESTAWEGVTRPTSEGGLGFNFKWNMGWMNDTLKFFSLDPIHRSHHYKLVNFTFMYMFHENFILPFSHDEVVHGKESLLGRMPGQTRYDEFSNLRTLEGYRMTYPGKKLTFMGNEIGQFLEWRFYSQLEWEDLDRPYNGEYQHYIQVLNQVYQEETALHQLDLSPEGIRFLEADDDQETTAAFIRRGRDLEDFIVCVYNFTPVERKSYRLGVPYPGTYRVLLNSEMQEFGGNWEYQQETYTTEKVPYQGFDHSLTIVLPSLSTFLLKPDQLLTERPEPLNKEDLVEGGERE